MRLVEQDPCFKSASPDEPAFILLARDRSAPKLVRQWAAIRRVDIECGTRPRTDLPQVEEAERLAERMKQWRIDADEVWRKQPSFFDGPLSDIGDAVAADDAFHDAVAHGVGVTQGGEHVPLQDFMHEHGNIERSGPHLFQHQGDEFFCPRCAKRWGIDEPAPPCRNPRREAMNRAGEV